MATTTGEKLVELSKLPTGTAMEHLLAITTGGGGNAPTIYAVDITNTSGIGLDDGSIVISANGGTPPYSYSLGGSYQASNTFTDLTEGTYTLIVKDASGYTDTISGIKLSAPSSETPIITELITTNASTTNSTDGSIRIIVTGGVEPYQYAIDDGIYQSNNLFSNLSIGNYSVSVKDSNNVVNRLSGIKVDAKVLPTSGGGGYGRSVNRYRTKVNVKNIRVKDINLDEGVKINITI